jgi:dTDP-glucose pyrophosphorylase
MELDRINRFALLDVAADGTLVDIVEKPTADHPLARAKERLVSMNLWRFTDAIFDDCAAVAPSPRGELELVDAVRGAMARGTRFAAVRQRVLVPDLTHRRDVAALESLLRGWMPAP